MSTSKPTLGKPTLGAHYAPEGVAFRVLAPAAKKVEVKLETGSQPMTAAEDGLFYAFVPDLPVGSRYRYRLDDSHDLPDPASRYQPEGVHGPSEVIDPRAYRWHDESWSGVPQKQLVFYELHVGTFTPEGSYNAARAKLPYLKELGVSAVELLPLADFPGRWNWGYDPAALFAPSRAYGSPDELRALIDEAHTLGLAVYLDVVYNHLGPDGAYAAAYLPQFFTDRHLTPWGQAINLDGEGAAGVRRLFLENALMWLSEYHLDGFRLDATFALVDNSPKHFLVELGELAKQLPGPRRLLIAEDPRNLRTLITSRSAGGYGLHGVWADDFHHQVRRATAGDNHGYYRDHSGRAADIATTLNGGWFYTGQHSAHAGAPRGSDASDLPAERFVFCIQNHDQVGNRPAGNRLTDDISPALYRAATALLLFAPQLPLLFMGQEWGASTPWLYFTDHNPELGKLVSQGRKEEFADFPGFGGEVPDPQDEATFRRSQLDWAELTEANHQRVHTLYRDLLTLRRTLWGEVTAHSPAAHALVLQREAHTLLLALADDVHVPFVTGNMELIWSSESPDYSETPRPPSVTPEGVTFAVPGAVIVRVF